MVRVASLFSQLLSHFPRSQFAALVKEHEAEAHAKGFSCWTQFVSMLFCHLAHADSLREICNGLRCGLGKLKHLGVLKAPKRSTLSYANAHRPSALYRDLFHSTYAHFSANGGLNIRKTKFRFKNPLLSLDSTTITLCLDLFPWADFRRSKGGVKVHTLLSHDSYMPIFAQITEGKTADLKVAQTLSPPKGSIVALDLGYIDYAMFGRWTSDGVYFVTRIKTHTQYEVVEERPVPQQRGHILSDQIIRLTGTKAKQDCPHLLRRVVVYDPDELIHLEFLTNHVKLGATTVAAIYKDRWEIELFFKALKQNLKVKTFVGTTRNALEIQIWTALIALLLLKWLHHLSKAKWSLSNLASMLRLNLLTYRDLAAWLDDPWNTEPILPGAEQLSLALPRLGQAAP
jgi:hypothetical protein